MDVAFLEKNILLVDPKLQNPKKEKLNKDRTVYVELAWTNLSYTSLVRIKNVKSKSFCCFTSAPSQKSVPAKLVIVRPSTQKSEGAFKAYICPYSNDFVHAIVLERAADVMFTANMDGCTFGIGQPSPQGVVRVAHANAQGIESKSDTPDPQRREQVRMLKQEGTDQHIVDPYAYVDRAPFGHGHTAVTVGLRDPKSNRWSFYYQHHLHDHPAMRTLLKLVQVN
ncbi:hypothetical protein GCM10007301_26850 [Azorhizobium oxalatiphilum]|uniref:Uncharacterized protein n=1 Tax=Azorhizobium oxalatiphilum TaxID=980631 RepID=A0A917C020_9HYPH|nr:hypothetical protein [Azorhizobium oxalatiphilum]GGF65763.1 hypothetical protein GCM10007301_26850 [Azorhizobium oxalatiphilum]